MCVYPQAFLCFFDGDGGMRVAHGVTLKSDLSDLSDKKGASRYTPRVCGALGGVARGEDVPLSSACLMAAGVCVSRGRDA